jgi:hypothetical protein
MKSLINVCLKLEKLLDNLASDIRFEMQQYALLGNIPRIVFVKGLNQFFSLEMFPNGPLIRFKQTLSLQLQLNQILCYVFAKS